MFRRYVVRVGNQDQKLVCCVEYRKMNAVMVEKIDLELEGLWCTNTGIPLCDEEV